MSLRQSTPMKNRYYNRSRVSEVKFRKIMRLFCEDIDASKVSTLVGVSRPTINKVFMKFRLRIAEITQQQSPFNGEIEIDESYFGAKRVRGKRGRGASEKIPVVGLFKRGGKVFTQIVASCSKKELLPVIQGKVMEGSTIYTDSWKSYDSLVVKGYKHHRIRHSHNEFAQGKNHINGIESFWSYTKRRLRKYNGVQKRYFFLHLKESEFRWNTENPEEMYSVLLRNFKINPL